MVKYNRCLGLLFSLTLQVSVVSGMQHHSDPPHNHQQGQQRRDGVNERGDHAMGFSHERATHHFRLTSDGGAIEVTANELNDTKSAEQIRGHLSHVARLFKEGDFSKPMFTHGEEPAGVAAMRRLKGVINYTFEEIERGGRVQITSTNTDAINAIHEFLRYQIKDHKTGDPLELNK
ncbi:MAG: hypothetical protein WAV20_12010 [Blastocatellia bacterium]